MHISIGMRWLFLEKGKHTNCTPLSKIKFDSSVAEWVHTRTHAQTKHWPQPKCVNMNTKCKTHTVNGKWKGERTNDTEWRDTRDVKLMRAIVDGVKWACNIRGAKCLRKVLLLLPLAKLENVPDFAEIKSLFSRSWPKVHDDTETVIGRFHRNTVFSSSLFYSHLSSAHCLCNRPIFMTREW